MSTTLHIPPQLRDAYAFVLNNSAGKDSAAMEMLEWTVVLHLDLGAAEWDGVSALAARQAEAYGIPFGPPRRRRYGPRGQLRPTPDHHLADGPLTQHGRGVDDRTGQRHSTPPGLSARTPCPASCARSSGGAPSSPPHGRTWTARPTTP